MQPFGRWTHWVIRVMAAITIPDPLADLQRSFDAARKAVRDHHRASGPVLESTEEKRAEGDRLQAKWVGVVKSAGRPLAVRTGGRARGARLGWALRKAVYGPSNRLVGGF